MAAPRRTRATSAETPEKDPMDLDELLAFTEEDSNPVAVEETAPEPPVEEDDEDARIAALQAELAKPAVKAPEYVPVNQRTEKQQRIADLEDQLAKKRANEDSGPSYEDSDSEDGVLIHILEDGFMVNGVIGYRGQEFFFPYDSLAYRQTSTTDGGSWLDLADDVEEQYRRYGSQKFASGPWRGRRWDNFAGMNDSERADAVRAAQAEKQRGRRAPVMSSF